MAYIEEEMKKRRGDASKDDQTDLQSKGYQDIYDELYKIPEHLKVRHLNTHTMSSYDISIYKSYFNHRLIKSL
jgi:hypothetical protein